LPTRALDADGEEPEDDADEGGGDQARPEVPPEVPRAVEVIDAGRALATQALDALEIATDPSRPPAIEG